MQNMTEYVPLVTFQQGKNTSRAMQNMTESS